MRWWSALLITFAGVACGLVPGDDPPPEVTGACFPIETHVSEGGLLPGGPTSPPLIRNTLGAARPDCPVTYELRLTTESARDDLRTWLRLSCGTWKMGVRDVPMPLSAFEGGWEGRVTVRGEDCASAEAVASAHTWGLPFYPANWAAWIEIEPSARSIEVGHVLRYVRFETWHDDSADVQLAFDVPEDHEAVENPVEFRLSAQDVHRVRLYDHLEDAWMGEAWDAVAQPSRTWDFETMGTRLITAFAYDAAGTQVAAAAVTVAPVQTVRMHQTYYYVAYESRHLGEEEVPWYRPDCVPHDVGGGSEEPKTVSLEFYQVACREGTAKFADGRVFNVVPCECDQLPARCGAVNRRYCWEQMSATNRWGLGNRNNPLEPLESAAVSAADMAFGQVVHVAHLDGMRIPAHDGVGGVTHSGCFRGDDVGTAIGPRDIDLFLGPEAVYFDLRATTSSAAVAIIGDPRCDGLRPASP